MPYRRRRRQRRSRAGAASTLQAAWRRKLRRKRGSVNQRQTIQNAKAIRKLKRAPEVKRTASMKATESNNYTGTTLQYTDVDNYSMSTNTTEWNAIAAGGFLPTPKYQPVAMMPIVTQQSTKEVGGRIGNDIRMKNLILKITVNGSSSDRNGGIWNGHPFKQQVRAMVVLDSEPSPANTSLLLPTPVFEPTAMPCQVFDYASNWNNMLSSGFPAATSIAQVPQLTDVLYSILEQTANPPGLGGSASSAASLVQRNLINEGFRNTDTLDKKRFKVLRVKDFSVDQLPSEAAGQEVRASNSAKHHTLVIKHPYKFHFDNDKVLTPSNQRIYVFFISDTPTARGNTTTPIADYVAPPFVQCVARMNYTDL